MKRRLPVFVEIKDEEIRNFVWNCLLFVHGLDWGHVGLAWLIFNFERLNYDLRNTCFGSENHPQKISQ